MEETKDEVIDASVELEKDVNISKEEVPKAKVPPLRRCDMRAFYIGETFDIKGLPFEVIKVSKKRMVIKPLPYPFVVGE